MTLYLLATSGLQAATFNVTNANNSGVGSLRQAVDDANTMPGVDTIAIDPALAGATIALASPLPALSESIILSGPPAGNTAVTSGTTIFTGGFAVTKQSAGTLIFTGANTYSGGTTIDDGAFQGDDDGIQGNIINNSAVIFDQPGVGTYDGDMTGSGSLTKQGAGTLILSGTNSYMGGTTVSAGTLQGNSISLQGNVVNNAEVVFDQAGAGIYAGDMSGSGSLTKRGIGTLTLTGTNSYAGGTIVEDGALRSDTDGLQGHIENDAAVIFDQAGAGTYVGNMSGSGTMTKLGAGTLILTGINSYAGGTTISAGTLQGNASSLQGSITNNSAIVFDQAGTGTYSGTITGSGNLTKQGAGTLTLSGNSSYVGGTSVVAGQLAVTGSILGPVTVQNGAALTGSGQVGSLTNNGAVAPGNSSIGTLTVNGDYVQNGGATLQVQINPAGQSDLLNTSGSATVDAALVSAGAGSFNAGTTYTILSTANGVNGTFSSTQFVFGSGAFQDSQLIYGSTEIQLLLLRNATMLANLAETPNQEAVASTLDALNPLATGDLALAIDQLNLLAPAGLPAALDQLTGEIYADLPAVEFENTTRYLSLVTERIRNNSCYSMGCCSVNDDDDRFGTSPPWNTWVLGYGMGADVSGDDNASGIDYTLMGTAVGVDSDLDEFTSVGVSYGFTPFLVDRNSDRVEAETHQVSVYANRLFGQQYLLGVVAFGRNDFEATRQIAFDDVNESAESEFSSGQFALYVEAGGNRNLGDYFIQPLVGLQYVNVSQDAFDETGAGSLDLTLPKTTTDSLRSALGGRIARPFFTEWGGMIAPEVRARWMHEFLNDPQNISPSFAVAPDDSFAISGVTLGRDFLVLGAGFTAELTPSISAFVNYDTQMSTNEQAHGGNGGLKWVW